MVFVGFGLAVAMAGMCSGLGLSGCGSLSMREYWNEFLSLGMPRRGPARRGLSMSEWLNLLESLERDWYR
jgi:hypothetical protein